MTGSDRVPYHTTRDTIPEGARQHFDSIVESRGGVRGPFGVLLNSPELAGLVGRLGAYIRFESELPAADRELAILTTARAFDCAYEWAAHVPIATEAGVSEATIDLVAEAAPTDDLDRNEAVVVDFGRELFGEHAVSDGTFEAALAQYGASGVTDLAGVFGYYALVACILNAFEVPPTPDQPQLP